MTEVDDDPDHELHRLYDEGLEHEAAGRRAEAIAAFEQVLELDPDDHGGALIRLASLGARPTPKSAPELYVTTLFDQHAEDFEAILVDALGYDVPNLIRVDLDRLGLGPFSMGLDLGCGTGLVGDALDGLVDEWTGVDLSSEMVSIAYDKEHYENLYVAEVVDYLSDNDEGMFDLIVAADVLPYLGDAGPLFEGVRESLNSGGVFAFSTQSCEESSEDSYFVGADHRFHHKPSYITDLLTRNGFAVLLQTEINVRDEDGAPTPGELIVARLDR